MHLKVIPFFTRVTAYHVIPCLWHLTGPKKTLLFHVMGSASPLAYSQWSVGSKIACSVESTSPGAVSSSSSQTLDPWCTRRFQLPLLHVASGMTSSAAFRFYTLGILHFTQSRYNHCHQSSIDSGVPKSMRGSPNSHRFRDRGFPYLWGPQIYITPNPKPVAPTLQKVVPVWSSLVVDTILPTPSSPVGG